MTFLKSFFRFIILKVYWKFNNSLKAGSKSIINLGSSFEGKNRVGTNCVLNDVRLGFGSYLGDSCKLTGVNIGKYSCIASNFKNIVGRHPINEFLSIHPAFYSVEKQAGFTYVHKQKFNELAYLSEEDRTFNKIGNDVWIGESVTLLSNIVIGDGAIIGAGSIVTKDCVPYGVYAGIPAKLIKFRFSEEEIKKLLDLKWWEKNETWIREKADFFDDINTLLY